MTEEKTERRKSSRLRESTHQHEPDKAVASAAKRRRTTGHKTEPDEQIIPSSKGRRARGQTKEPEDAPESGESSELNMKIVLLPSKIVDGQQLPTLPEPQSKDLNWSQWQTVAESGVLALSLKLSTQTWMHNMFETYWSKSTYKKKKELAENNRTIVKGSKPSMTKIGTCRMTALPHIFDVSIFVIKDPAPPPPTQGDRQFVTYGPGSTSVPAVPYHTPPSYTQARPQPAVSAPKYSHPSSGHATPTSTNHPTAANGQGPQQPVQFHAQASQAPAARQPAPTPMPKPTTTQPPNANRAPVSSSTPVPASKPATPVVRSPSQNTARAPVANGNQPPQPVNKTTLSGPPTGSATASRNPTQQQNRPSPANHPNEPPRQAPNANNDPVIQMLAQRASSDNALRRVMKVVAIGKAGQSELQYFQRHIDELTQIVANQQAEEEGKRQAALQQQQQRLQQPKPSQPAAPRAPNQTPATSTYQLSAQTPQYPPKYQQPLPKTSTPINAPPRPVYHAPPVAPRAPPRPIYVPPPLHVLMEFGQNTTDRFLFPKESILEYSTDGNSVTASFLVVKKESQLLAAGMAESKRGKRGETKAAAAKAASEGAENTPDTKAGASAVLEHPTTKASQAKNKNDETVTASDRELYLPVTVRFEAASDPSVLSVFGRIVAPAEEVRKEMIKIAERTERAPDSHLVMRLPREPKEVEVEPQATTSS